MTRRPTSIEREAQRGHAADNLIAAFELVARYSSDARAATRRFGDVVAVRTGIDHPFYNPALALHGTEQPDDMLAAALWIEAAGVPASIQVGSAADRRLAAPLGAAGFDGEADATPVMVLDPIGPADALPDEIEILTGGGELAEQWHAAVGWELGRLVLPASLMTDPSVVVAVGRLGGESVAHAAAILSGDTVGVYAVGTAERARRRGLGRAVTWAVIEAGVGAWGVRRAILQSSDMGYALYASMGFVEIDRIRQYARRAARQPASVPQPDHEI